MESGQSGDGASHGHTSTVVETAKEEALAGGYDEEEEDCTPLPNGLICSRQNWETMYGKFGAFEDETDASPMRNTDRPVPPYYLPISMMQFFSVKVIEIMGGLQWPLHVYGIVATRDSQDNKRNFLFRCDREHCQTLASPQDSCLRLTRPSRAIVIVNPVVVEVDLKVKGSRGPPSEDKVLSEHAFVHNHTGHRIKPGFPHRQLESTEDSTMEFVFAHLQSAVEATITVGVVEGSPDFRARFTARTAGIDEDVLLLDFQDGPKVVVDDDGFVVLRRRVVSVEGTGKLILRMEATDHGGDDTAVVKEEIFCARKTSRSQSYFMLGFCKLSIIIAWSLLP
ncbi:uncharacterized protein [Oryza sativa Japonica Group]|nr:uncharacterized protein LOC9267893 isoform X4 [Oryza sativa Japonica Group]XP_015620129.1 uncharacterized protein LOC9267893 isoform X4 [Oryza sativa Japonica Group]XP_015620130.1 uncharacterized protein LOC9267893 isoform X4 [Oryza sativa Japonica Group]KAF2906856.1 hypothetical protein DAI22_12g051700 [Oryza sativa Japonica Group]